MEAPAVLEPPAGPASCDRCGDFAPLAPIGPRWLCASCVAKRHAILAGPPSVGLYVRWSFALLRSIGVPAGLMWAALTGVSGLANLGLQIATGYDATNTADAFVYSFVAMGLFLLVSAYCTGFQTALAVQAVDGAVDWRAAARTAAGRYPAILGATALTWAGTFLGCACCLVPGVVLSLVWSLPIQAIVVHGAGPVAALSRSMRAVKGAWVEIGLAFTATTLVYFAVQMVIGLPTSGYVGFLAVDSGPQAVAEVASAPWFRAATLLGGVIGSFGYLPLVNTAVVAYLNRTEGAN